MGLRSRVAGPWSSEPVPSKRAPWHGHTNSSLPREYWTRQPACGQTALNAAYRPAVGWTTYAGPPDPGSMNAATPPTGTAVAAPMSTPPDASAVVVGPWGGPVVVGGREATVPLSPPLPVSSRPIQAVA